MSEVRYNNSVGQLGAPMGASDTSITFTGSPGWATLADGDYIKLVIDPTLGSAAPTPNPLFEIVYVTAYTGGASTGTIERGQEGTTAQAHAVNAIWMNGATAADFEGAIEVTDGTTTVTNVAEIEFTAGATVTNGGSGLAEVAITGAPPTGAAGGALSGTYPDPGLSASAVAIPDGWTATTQAALDDSTKLGTTAYADAAVGVEKSRAEAAEALLAPIASPTFTGTTTAPEYSASGLTGATAASRYVGATASGAPTSGTFAVGDFVIDQSGKVWICTTAGSPGTWTEVAGGGGSGVTSFNTRTGAVVPGNADYLAVAVGGLTGAVAATRYVGGTTSGAPTAGTFAVGDFVIAQNGVIWICTVAGTPGTWVQITGTGSGIAIGDPVSGGTDGQLLGIDGSGNLTDPLATSSVVSVTTGTAPQIDSATAEVDQNFIYYDAASGKFKGKTVSSGGSSVTVQGAVGTNLGATATVNFASTEQEIWLVGTMNADLTVTLSNRVAGCKLKMLLTQGGAGSYTLTVSDGTTSAAVPIPTAGYFAVEAACPDATNIDVSLVTTAPTTVTVTDGTHTEIGVTTITVSGATVSTTGAGEATITIAGGGVAARASRAASQSIAVNTSTKILFDTVTFDTTGAMVDVVTNNRINIVQAGYYVVLGAVNVGVTGQDAFVGLHKNGAPWINGNLNHAINYGALAPSVGDLMELAVNDYLELYVEVSSSTSVGGQSVFLAATRVA